MKKSICVLMILLFLPLSRCFAEADGPSRQQVRERYLDVLHKIEALESVDIPVAAPPYEVVLPGEAVLDAALEEANFIRWLAGQTPLEVEEALCVAAQSAAALSAATEGLSHDPARPRDMDDEFYEAGRAAAAACNLAMFNWRAGDVLNAAVRGFARDDGEGNRETLGHRRWLLYPGMARTGFGLASDEAGRSYAAMYALDNSAEPDEYDLILWPSRGAFPAEYMKEDTAWSISPDPRLYDLESSHPRVTLTEENSGARFAFEEGDGLIWGGGRYGDGPALIFCPDLAKWEALMYGYQQNQRWTVRLEGLVQARSGEPAEAEYTVEMISLTPQDPAAVEIEPRKAEIRVGEALLLTARVVPDWADDVSVVWRSEDEGVAAVDEHGRLAGVAPGTVRIIASSVNGREDWIEVTVVR